MVNLGWRSDPALGNIGAETILTSGWRSDMLIKTMSATASACFELPA
jgi:hypothetical protein